MLNIRESAIEIIKKLPENCTLEDIQYELYAKKKIVAGLEDINNGNTVSEKEMDNEIRLWQDWYGQKIPEMSEEFVSQVSERYIELYEKIIGKKFQKANIENIEQRIINNVISYL